jgi:8-oxo-dGTP pyrophosphatase MutT (NUDIX family)
VVLVANFRPPVGKFVIEFPSGLVESNDYEANAQRELLEETGFIAKRFVTMPLSQIYSDPWKSNENGMLYLGVIDGDDPNSHHAQ